MFLKIKDLADYLNCSKGTLYHMKKTNPKRFELLWLGFIQKMEKSK